MAELPPPPGPPVDTSVPYAPPLWAAPTRPPVVEPRALHPTLPLAAAVGAVVTLSISLLVSKYLLDALVGFGWPVVVYVVLLACVGYGPSLAWCKVASDRWGTGRVGHDLGLTPRWTDLAWGPLVWITAVGCQIVIGAIVLVLDVPISRNTDGISELRADRTYVVAIVVTAVIAAPLVEELVFRGLVLRGLLSRVPVVAAVVLQAVLFGVAHVDPVRGSGNIGLVLVLSGVGAAFGGAAYLLRRIGPTVVAHAIFNGVVLAIVLSGVADDIGDDRLATAVSAVDEQAVVDETNVSEPDGGRDTR